MAGNPYTKVKLDPRPERVTGAGRHAAQEALAGSDADVDNFDDEFGPVVSFGRGTNDVNITFIALFNTNGDKIYLYPNADGNGVVATATKP